MGRHVIAIAIAIAFGSMTRPETAGDQRNGDVGGRTLALRPRDGRPRTRGRSGVAQPLQLGQDGVESLALDELHHVEVSRLVVADAEDRHDVRVMQPRRGPRLALEPADVLGIGQRPGRQHLQRHTATERLLLGLVNHPHPAAADLAGSKARTRQAGRWSPRRPCPPAVAIEPVRPAVSAPRSSISSKAGNNAAISSARSGCRAAYSSAVAASPLRFRARNSSARTSTGLRLATRRSTIGASFRDVARVSGQDAGLFLKPGSAARTTVILLSARI